MRFGIEGIPVFGPFQARHFRGSRLTFRIYLSDRGRAGLEKIGGKWKMCECARNSNCKENLGFNSSDTAPKWYIGVQASPLSRFWIEESTILGTIEEEVILRGKVDPAIRNEISSFVIWFSRKFCLICEGVFVLH